MSQIFNPEILTISQMYAADEAAISNGVSGYELMEAAGASVAREIQKRWASRSVTVLCGPGNNGGDGFVVGRYLLSAGWDVTIAILGAQEDMSGGDAQRHAEQWPGDIEPLSTKVLTNAGLIVDAVFGAGLTRPVEGVVCEVLTAAVESTAPIVAVDIPSGVHGDTGGVLGMAPLAQLTVTFFRRKPGHLLLPGREYCGETVLADIGIASDVLKTIKPKVNANSPGLWFDLFPVPQPADHKYSRGHALIVGGMRMPGAGRLAAAAARRIGAGIVSVLADPMALSIFTQDAPGLLALPFRNAGEFDEYLDDPRRNAVLIGPGAGANRTTRELVLMTARRKKQLVLDADGLTVFSDEASTLFEAISDVSCVLTPHEGEFSRIFRISGDKLTRAKNAALQSQSVVVLKGSDTVIAAPDGRVVINENAPSTLATAGSGDVLAGSIVGLMAQGMPAFEAACGATWINADVAAQYGPGLIAEDLPKGIPSSLRKLMSSDRARQV